MANLKENISVVIQGPIDDRTYESIDSYAEQGFTDIIVSTWEDEDLSLLEKTKNHFNIVLSQYPDKVKIKNEGAKFYIAQTTLSGCLQAKGEYVLKVRSDELYPDLDKFIKNFENHPNRIHTTNNGFWKHIPACFSNHIFLSKKSLMIDCCNNIVHYCLDDSGVDDLAAEQVFGISFIQVLGGNTQNWKEEFKNHIFITPCHDLPNHLHSGQSSSHHRFRRHTDYPNNRPDGKHHNLKNLYNHHSEIL